MIYVAFFWHGINAVLALVIAMFAFHQFWSVNSAMTALFIFMLVMNAIEAGAKAVGVLA